MVNVLLIGPSFFGYRSMIAAELRSQGYSVEEFIDRPSESVPFKSISRISYRLVESTISKHAQIIIQKLSNGSYDFFLYLSGMSFCFTRHQFEVMRSVAPHTKFIAGLWDAIANCQRFCACKDLFDEVYSFEPGDCDAYGLTFRPLFYSDAYTLLPAEPENGFEYDACFIGSVHQPSKFEAVKSICDTLEAQGMRVFKYFFMPSKSAELLRKTTNSIYRGIEFKYKPLSINQIISVYRRTKAVIDSPQSNQLGLTIRTLETLGARRKLITTNADVKNYDFFEFGDVFIVNETVLPDRAFFSRPYSELPRDIYESYSIHAFVKSLLGEMPTYCGYEKEPK